MDHPAYPSKTTLRHERVSENLCATQKENTYKYRKLVVNFLTEFYDLEFPLGSPSQHYDIDDIADLLNDTLIERDAAALEEIADDIARSEDI